MSTINHGSYIEAFRDFRMNIAEGDFRDDYPETAEMTLAICSGLKYHYLHNYRKLTIDQTVQLIRLFSKRCERLDNYRNVLSDDYNSSSSLISSHHNYDGNDLSFAEWLLLCHMCGLISADAEFIHIIRTTLAHENAYTNRTVVQLKILDNDIVRRKELQQRLAKSGMLVNRIDRFNVLYRFERKIIHEKGLEVYDTVIDTYYTGHVNERLGTDTIYEWILNDDADKFQQWYTDGGLHSYDNQLRGEEKRFNFGSQVAKHILASNAKNIIRFILLNNIHAFLDSISGIYALMDPWKYPVNDPECFRLLQEHFHEQHKRIVQRFINDDFSPYWFSDYVYRHITPDIAYAIFTEINELYYSLYNDDNMCMQVSIAVQMAKYGHVIPIESIDLVSLSARLSNKDNYTEEESKCIMRWKRLFFSRQTLLNGACDNCPFGMNPSTAVYLHDLLSENGLIRIQLQDHIVELIEFDHRYELTNDNRLTMAEFEEEAARFLTASEGSEEEWVCTDDELYW